MKKSSLFFALACLLTCACNKGEEQKAEQTNYQSIDTVPMLVMQVQKCSKLYTSEFKVHKIVTHDDVVRLRGQLFSRDYDVALPIGDRKVAIPMDATLKAYIDFANFSEENVRRQNGKITITLPDPRVVMTDTKIDQKGVREYVSLTRSHFSDRELSAYEQQGREAIIANIPKMGIIERARESAARQLIPIIAQMGYEEENITISFSRDFSITDIRTLLELNNVER